METGPPSSISEIDEDSLRESSRRYSLAHSHARFARKVLRKLKLQIPTTCVSETINRESCDRPRDTSHYRRAARKNVFLYPRSAAFAALVRAERSELSPSRVSEAQRMWMQQPVAFGGGGPEDQPRCYARPWGGRWITRVARRPPFDLGKLARA